MQKNICLLLTAGVLLNVAAFAGDETASTEDNTPSNEVRVVAYVNSGDETASTQEEETPASALFSVAGDKEDVPADDLFAADSDDTDGEEETPADCCC